MENPCCGLNVKDLPFGAKGDTKKRSDGKIDAGKKTLTIKKKGFRR